MPTPSDKPEPSYGALLGIGLAMALAFVIPLLLGLLADANLHHSPLGVGAGLLLGIVAAVTVTYQRFKRYW